MGKTCRTGRNLKTTKEKYWVGHIPDQCDLCHRSITKVFVDGRTNFGPWAIMDPQCHRASGQGLGTGRGQRYVRQLDGRFKKVAPKEVAPFANKQLLKDRAERLAELEEI